MGFKRKNNMAPLSEVPELDTSNRSDVLNSVEQLQIWASDETKLNSLSIEELLELHQKLEASLEMGL